MKKKSTACSSTQISKQYLKLNDLATALEYGQLTNDKRIQVKMPSEIVEQLKVSFPHIDRSKLLTKLAVDALINHYRYLENQDLYINQLAEQEDLDEMWQYLAKRERVAKKNYAK